MSKTSEDIVRDLLRDANYYWYDDNDDNVQQLNPEDFDPVVDKIFKANAFEIEKLYAEISESQQEIILGLSQSLLPDQSLLPEPGYTVAQINPNATRIHMDIEDSFQINGQNDLGEQFEYYFTPMFEHNFPNCEIVAILSDSLAMQVNNNEVEVAKNINAGNESNQFWLGLEIEKVKENDSLSFFLGNSIVDEFDKDHHIFHAAKWLLNGDPEKELKVTKGIASFDQLSKKESQNDLLDTIDIPNSYEKQIFSRFRNSFIQVNLPPDIDSFKYRVPPHFDGSELTSTLDIKNPICWIKLEFPLALPNDYLKKNILYPNAVPLVNRRLKDNFVVKSNYDRIVIPMPTNDFFLDVHAIQDTNNKEVGPESKYQKVDFINPDSRPGTFTLRSGARVRRLNQEDASRQIYRLLELIQDEYSTFKEEGVNRLRVDFDIIDKAIKRIKSQFPDYFRQEEGRMSHFCIANFRANVNRLYCQYWETQGEEIKHLGDKVGLEVSSDDINITNSKSIIPIQHGKSELKSDDYINQLKIALLSRGRIMTKGDIEMYCKSRYGQILRVENIGRKLMDLEEGKRGRGILVSVKLINPLPKAAAELIRIELQNDLNAKSAFFTLIKVELNYAD